MGDHSLICFCSPRVLRGAVRQFSTRFCLLQIPGVETVPGVINRVRDHQRRKSLITESPLISGAIWLLTRESLGCWRFPRAGAYWSVQNPRVRHVVCSDRIGRGPDQTFKNSPSPQILNAATELVYSWQPGSAPVQRRFSSFSN